ncbi:MAG TPA: GNAT family N-acetyltransferase [Stellaceae bacterium]|nr:GNAT family N-acetyltransferase [Stellaceae bacterium]
MADSRPLAEADLPEAQRIIRRAFGTFLGAPDLDTFWQDFDYVYGRFGCEHTRAFAADADGALAGVNFATRWGGVGFFGPLSTRPDLWNRGLAQPLVAAASDAFEEWGVSHAGLCTFPHSTKHVWLYQKFGFYPRFLTAIMAAPVHPHPDPPPIAGEGRVGVAPRPGVGPCTRYSELLAGQQQEAEDAARDLCDAVYPDLDLTGEVRTVRARALGDTLLLWEGSRLAGFAVCHWGPASEAGAGCLYVKFGAARPGAGGEARFAALLDGCAALARQAGMTEVVAGVSTAREEAYRHMLTRGFRSRIHVVTMHRPNAPGYSRPGLFVLDDWR